MANDDAVIYLGWLRLPDGRRASGTVDLTRGQRPNISVRADEPKAIGPEGKGFPVYSKCDRLIFHAQTNDEIVLGGVQIIEWFPEQFRISASWALVGLDVARTAESGWPRVRVRISGLETLIPHPIRTVAWPAANAIPSEFGATVDSSHLESTADGVTVNASFDVSFSAFDGYEFRLRTFANVSFERSSPAPVDEWVDQWIQPLLRLVILATGEREEIRSVELISGAVTDPLELGDAGEVRARLWSAGITSGDEQAIRRTRPDGDPLIPLFQLAGAPPLAEILVAWRERIDAVSATSLYFAAIDPSQATETRFLLLSQALEAMDTAERRTIESEQDSRYALRYSAALEALSVFADTELDRNSKSFLRRNLGRAPRRSLTERLERHIRRLPDSGRIASWWVGRTSDLAQTLEMQNRPTAGISQTLSSARNTLSHGDLVPRRELEPGRCALEMLLRLRLMQMLGFSDDQLLNAIEIELSREP